MPASGARVPSCLLQRVAPARLLAGPLQKIPGSTSGTNSHFFYLRIKEPNVGLHFNDLQLNTDIKCITLDHRVAQFNCVTLSPSFIQNLHSGTTLFMPRIQIKPSGDFHSMSQKSLHFLSEVNFQNCLNRLKISAFRDGRKSRPL
jgi:hypothetical protein